MSLPSWVLEEVGKVSSMVSIEFNEALEMYKQILLDPFIQSDPQFRTDEDRYKFALELLRVKLVSQPPTKECVVVPIGMTGLRPTKQGLMNRVYAIVKSKGAPKEELSVILFRGPQAEKSEELLLYHAYKTRLARIKESLYLATSVSKFENPSMLTVDPLTFLNNVGIKRVSISEVPYNLSRVVNNYVDELDLRIVVGIVLRYNFGKRPSGTEWALYTIANGSSSKESVTPDGIIVPTQLTVWIPRKMLKYDVDSKLAFVGTLQLSQDKEPFMNAIYVYPLIKKDLVL